MKALLQESVRRRVRAHAAFLLRFSSDRLDCSDEVPDVFGSSKLSGPFTSTFPSVSELLNLKYLSEMKANLGDLQSAVQNG